MDKPIIGILASSEEMNGGVRMFVNTSYCRAITDNGGMPLIIPCVGTKEERRGLFELCDGILFPGGDDVDPHLFGEEPHAGIGFMNEEEDLAGFDVAAFANERGLPVLGICKGLQLVDIAMGGSVYQDIAEYPGETLLHARGSQSDYPVHTVTFTPDSRIGQLLGVDHIRTNSCHHQCAKKIGEGLKVTARTPDGVVEALEDETGRILLVQWHPELLRARDPRMNALFAELVRLAAEHRRKMS